jgi:hypothetical protein
MSEQEVRFQQAQCANVNVLVVMVAVITALKATPVAAVMGAALTATGGTAGVCSRPQPPISPVASNARTPIIRTVSLLM